MNIPSLRDAIRRKNLSIAQVAKLMGINQSTFHRKLHANGNAFSVGEVKRLTEILELSTSEISNIFFAP